MKKITVFILLLFLIGCSFNDIQQNKDLEAWIHSIVEEKVESEIALTALTTFNWEKAFLFTPYSTEKLIEEELGMDFKDPSNIDRRDDIYLLVFINEDKPVQYAEIKRLGADFSINENTYLTPSNDLVKIEWY